MPDDNDIEGRFGDISGRFGDISGRSIEELQQLFIRDRLLDRVEFLEGRVNRLENDIFMIAKVLDARVRKIEEQLNNPILTNNRSQPPAADNAG